MKKFLGIDPGTTGAISVINEDGTLLSCVEIPRVGKNYDLRAINKAITEHEIHFACIEFQQVMGQEGVVGAFTTGFGYGILVMALEANNIPYTEVRPPAWKKTFTLLKKEKADSVRCAQKLFPSGQFLGPRGGLLHGKAESCLIGEYGRRMNLGIYN